MLLTPVLLCLGAGALSSCATKSAVTAPGPQPTLSATTFTSYDGDHFPYQNWVPDREPTIVVIGFHGIAGASTDLRNLGEYLLEHLPGAAVYAPDLRGQGNDPDVSRRGDIGHPREWFKDAYTFTRLVRARHAGARVVWCGESMGSLIALHAAASAPGGTMPCDALILSSPIARIDGDFPAWRRTALGLGAFLFPRARISLESLSGHDEVRVIRDVVHQDQVQTNPYHLSEFTLRLLHALGGMIEKMPDQAGRVDFPVLLLHGGHDIFSDPSDVVSFQDRFGSAPVQRAFYPESYHLLFFDHQRERVLRDITRWLRKLKVRPGKG